MERTLLRIGIDIGGTFTDFVIYNSFTGRIDTIKVLSTPSNPADAVIDGINRILQSIDDVDNNIELEIIHGSTVATNALIERKGAKTALITSRGFRDILQIGRQNRPELYNLFPNKPPPLVPEELRFEANERVDHHGNVLVALNHAVFEPLMNSFRTQNVKSVAICFLFSYMHPDHEIQVANEFNAAGFHVSISSEVLPEFREYERTSTTAVNAYVSPVLEHYLSDLDEKISTFKPPTKFRMMQSNGGSLQLGEAKKFGVRCVLSGPAGGIVGARVSADLSILEKEGKDQVEDAPLKLITFDMGGTSTDVSLINKTPRITTESIIGGCPIGIPMLDIHTIGAGGGSIAFRDLGGALRVGPVSAGADPGPACYGRGIFPTVTDANLFLGRLIPERFLGGEMVLDEKRASDSIERLSDQLNLSPISTALGIIDVVNANMERALRVISVERGYDPREFELVSFGGAGGLHATDLARRLGVPKVLIPPIASTMSAFGMLSSDIVKDYSQTVMFSENVDPATIEVGLTHFEEMGRDEIAKETGLTDLVSVERSLDVRYLGQSYELTIPYCEDITSEFHRYHQNAYGYTQPESPIEIVNLRVRVIGHVPQIKIVPHTTLIHEEYKALLGYREVFLSTNRSIIPVYIGEMLLYNDEIVGPAIITRMDTTILLNHGDHGSVDQYGNLLINIITSSYTGIS